MRSDARKAALIAALTSLGINPYDKEIELNYEQVLELRKTLKEEYDIDVVIKTDIDEMLSKDSLEEFVFTKKPEMEFIGTPPDGKAKRRERRRLERLQKKRRR